MKLLVFVCALLAAEAAKLQGYEIQQPGSTGVSLPIFSGGQIQSVGSFSAQPSQSFSGSGQSFSGSGQSFSGVGQSFSGPGQSFSGAGDSFSGAGQSYSGAGQSFSGPGQSFSGAGESFSGAGQSFSGAGQSSSGSGQSFVGSVSQSSGPSSTQSFSSASGQVGPSVGFGQASFISSNTQFSGSDGSCQEGQVRHFDGRCVTPEISRNVFVYAAPAQEPRGYSAPVDIPLPKVEHNIVFIRTQDNAEGQDPIIVPPPQKKHIIYVLNKESEQVQKVIEVTAPPPKNPEVYFVNYADGETPTLPDGIDFETALNSAVHGEGQLIGNDGAFITNDAGNAFTNEFGSDSGFGSGLIDSGNTGVSFVSGSDISGGNFVSGNDGNSFVSGNNGISFVSGNDGNTFVSGNDGNSFVSGNAGNSFVSGNDGNGNFGGSQTFVSNNGFSGGINNNIVDSSFNNNFQASPSVGTSIPQPFYSTP